MIYLDHAATTPIKPRALNEMIQVMAYQYPGNPGSIHACGRVAADAVKHAREQVAALINAEPEEIIFTSGATESNSLFASMVGLQKKFLISTKMEHSSVRSLPSESAMCIPYHHNYSADVVKIPDALTGFRVAPRVMSVMWVNNETGTIFPVWKLAEICEAEGIEMHTDASQAVGHIPVDVKAAGVDYMTFSAHKFGGPMGVGALYVKGGVQKRHSPLMYGGHQEFGIRPGTENIPGIVGFGAAAEIAMKDMKEERRKYHQLRTAFLATLRSYITKPYYINGGENVVDNIISLTIPDVNSESLLLMLDAKGICVSAGSACNAHGSNVSSVLLAMGLSEADAACTIRISLGWDTTLDEVNTAAREIARAASVILKLNR